jgi:hypothetical protein
MPGIIEHFEAKLLKFFGWMATVSIAVQNSSDTGFFQCLQFVININHSSVIGRIGNIEGNDMEIFSGQGAGDLTVKYTAKILTFFNVKFLK